MVQRQKKYLDRLNDSDIDFVITWVDGSDPEWLREKNRYAAQEKQELWSEWSMGDKRFREWGLLRYVFRSFNQFTPWVRKVHFVTWGHVPDWLNLDNPKLNVVKHADYIPTQYLPTFNSHTIELNMHRIEGLSEQFVYFNDDTIVVKPLEKTDFFKNGLPLDFAGLSASRLSRTRTSYDAYNAMIVSEHYDKNKVIRAHPLQWFNPKYGLKCLSKTMFLISFDRFSGFQGDHLPMKFLKSTFEEVWRLEEAELDMACMDKFRGFYSYSPWLMRDWQRASGRFYPDRADLNAYYAGDFFNNRENVKKLHHDVTSGKHKMICINDECSDDDYTYWNFSICEVLDELLPTKSSFEL